ncbi:MAG: methionyl-tRNA formyltransferase [Anaerolineae bacterium]
MARIVFMGTPEFAVPVLDALANAHQVTGVVTQPDRPRGRGRRLAPSPIKQVALERSLPLSQPQSLRTPEAVAQLAAWEPEVIVVAAFGQLLQQDVLDLPPHGCLNVHASLLPRWRGAAPIAAAILAGDEITGVTIMRMDAGLDTGPILAQREEPIRPDDTRATLGKRLARLGAALLVETLPAYLAGVLLSRSQPEDGVIYAGQLRREDGLLDWSRSAVELDRQIRAFTPWPGAFTTWRGRRLKVLRAVPLLGWQGEVPPGTVIALADGSTEASTARLSSPKSELSRTSSAEALAEVGAAIATSNGALCLEEVQLAGKRSMDIKAFLRGQRDFVGSRLGVAQE